jgi:hypothetical protein
LTDLTTLIAQLEEEKSAIETALDALRRVAGTTTVKRGPGRPPGKKAAGRPRKATGSRITEEGRKRLAEAMRKRWAAKRAGTRKKR